MESEFNSNEYEELSSKKSDYLAAQRKITSIKTELANCITYLEDAISILKVDFVVNSGKSEAQKKLEIEKTLLEIQQDNINSIKSEIDLEIQAINNMMSDLES